jgi:DNA repair protein RecN (Recombination protein N)
MLRHLQIRDLAIIDAVEIDFIAGLTVLTGETGAGKSILVDALELLGGGRAGAEVVRAGAERADLSATVDISKVGGELKHILEEQSIPQEGELLLRRVIGNDGRSRAWINGQSVPVTVLRAVGELLFDIHGQHEFQSLMRSNSQRELLDEFGQLESKVGLVRAAHAAWLTLMNRSVTAEAAASDRHARLDLLRYQVQELEALRLGEDEITTLNEEHVRMGHSDKLVQTARTALDGLYEAEQGNAHQLLARVATAMRNAGALDARLAALQPTIDEAAERVQEVAHSLARYLETLEFDPARQEIVERRLATIEELARKHRVEPRELPAWHGALQRELASMESAAADIGSLRTQAAAAMATYQEQARKLTAARTSAARTFASAVTRRMQELGMAGGHFVADVTPLESAEPATHGVDRVEFRVTTNPGQPPRAVAKIASGGELARLSLAVQVCCARTAAPCMVFDEVDAGIGGAVAEIVGRELRGLGTGAQALCVTHLAQVAAQGHQHLRVAKLTDGRSTRIAVTALSPEARIEEIARMLGGLEITAKARSHAVEMLERAASAQAPVAPSAATPRRRRGTPS